MSKRIRILSRCPVCARRNKAHRTFCPNCFYRGVHVNLVSDPGGRKDKVNNKKKKKRIKQKLLAS